MDLPGLPTVAPEQGNTCNPLDREVRSIYNPLRNRRNAYRTIRCLLNRDDVEAHRRGIDALFREYGRAIQAFLRLIPIRAPDPSTFSKEDYAAIKAKVPGLMSDLRMAARDKALEMWRSHERLSENGYRPTMPGTAPRKAGAGGRSHRDRDRTGDLPYGHRPYLDTIRLYRRVHPIEIDELGQYIAVSIPVPGDEGRIKLRIMGRGYQHRILRRVLSGEGGVSRRSGELIWRGTRKGGGGASRRRRRRRESRRMGERGEEQDGGGDWKGETDPEPSPGRGRDLFLDIRISRPLTRLQTSLPDLPEDVSPHGLVPVGVDLGLVNTAVAVAPGMGQRGVLFFEGAGDRAKRTRIRERRRLMAELGRKREVRALYEKEARYVRHRNHEISRRIVDMAGELADRADGQVPVIVLENLRFARDAMAPSASMATEQGRELGSWSFRQLTDLIMEKAMWEGIPVVRVDPRGTGLRCPRCGKEAHRRRDVHRIVCPHCTYRANDDYCSAVNIARVFEWEMEARHGPGEGRAGRDLGEGRAGRDLEEGEPADGSGDRKAGPATSMMDLAGL